MVISPPGATTLVVSRVAAFCVVPRVNTGGRVAPAGSRFAIRFAWPSIGLLPELLSTAFTVIVTCESPAFCGCQVPRHSPSPTYWSGRGSSRLFHVAVTVVLGLEILMSGVLETLTSDLTR